MSMVFCRGCGKEIHESAPTCPHCGFVQGVQKKSGASTTVLRDPVNYDTLPNVWKERFEFFEKNGAPNTPEFKSEIKLLKWSKKILINVNWFVFFFSFIYYFIKGMWKPALSVIAMLIALVVILEIFSVSDRIQNIFFTALGVLNARCANYSVYRFAILKEHDFNVFKGIF